MNKPNWPVVPLSKVVVPVHRTVTITPGISYRTLGVKWWGEGAYERQTIDGAQTAAKTLNVVKEDDLIINKIWVRHGSVAVVGRDVAGCYGSNEFPTFEFRRESIEPRWMHWYSKSRELWTKCDLLSRGTSGKNRIRPEKFMTVEVPLPELKVQQRIVDRIDSLVSKIQEAQVLADKSNLLTNGFLNSFFHRISSDAPRRSLNEAAPLVRRPTVVQVSEEYPQVSVRSFGKGTFHNPPLRGSEITWQKPFRVHCGDILISNIKAWEGAIAVAGPMDDGRFGSHRYLTFVPKLELVTAQYVCFYLLTPEGLFHVGESSPGSADRNRTLSAKKLLDIRIPLPPLHLQQQFDSLVTKVLLAREIRTKTIDACNAMLPSILDRAFKGAL